MPTLSLETVHSSWQPIIKESLSQVDETYLSQLKSNHQWLPGHQQLFAAFSLPLSDTRYILFGESPYPRKQSANGYAFWDANVKELWCEKGLAVPVNRATSLRNMMKMLLLSEGLLSAENMSQTDIAVLDKQGLVKDAYQLFSNMLRAGFLLLNASLVLSEQPVRREANYWQPFIATVLAQLVKVKPDIKLLLFGKIAESINQLSHAMTFKQLVAEHPYNISFITNTNIIDFFRPLHLLRKDA